MLIKIKQGEGGKDRVTLLAKQVLIELRAYYCKYRPKDYLFEGPAGGAYSGKTTESHTHLAKNAFKKIKNPLD